jgi:hypothetical protein
MACTVIPGVVEDSIKINEYGYTYAAMTVPDLPSLPSPFAAEYGKLGPLTISSSQFHVQWLGNPVAPEYSAVKTDPDTKVRKLLLVNVDGFKKLVDWTGAPPPTFKVNSTASLRSFSFDKYEQAYMTFELRGEDDNGFFVYRERR